MTRKLWTLILYCLLPTFLYCDSGILAEGKTKIVRVYADDPYLAIFEAKDDLTAFNSLKHDILPGKAKFATATTCNVFRLLADCNLPVAFREQIDSTKFLGALCEMVLYEVVVRREAHGSYLKRHPDLKKGTYFSDLVVEFFLKTSNHDWKGNYIPKDDPFIQFRDGIAWLYLPDVPVENQEPFMALADYPLNDQPEYFEVMSLLAKQTFLALEKAWQIEGGRLVDFKVEFGFDSLGNLLLADVIDNDSWRVVQNDSYIDKQVYRDGGTLATVAGLYERVAQLTGHFRVPLQQVILWRASEEDDFTPFINAFEPYANEKLKIRTITEEDEDSPSVQSLLKETPESVIIAIRCDGDCPEFAKVTTPILSTACACDAEQAMMMAFRILALRNPSLYMQLRSQQEE